MHHGATRCSTVQHVASQHDGLHRAACCGRRNRPQLAPAPGAAAGREPHASNCGQRFGNAQIVYVPCLVPLHPAHGACRACHLECNATIYIYGCTMRRSLRSVAPSACLLACLLACGIVVAPCVASAHPRAAASHRIMRSASHRIASSQGPGGFAFAFSVCARACVRQRGRSLAHARPREHRLLRRALLVARSHAPSLRRILGAHPQPRRREPYRRATDLAG